MVQVLQGIPSFGSQLAQVLTQAGVDIGQGFQQRAVNKKDQTILDQISQGVSSGTMSPVQALVTSQGLSKDKRESFVSGYTPIAKQQAETQAKIAEEKAKKEEETRGLKESLESLKKDIPYTGTAILGGKSFFGNVPGTEAYEKREKFDSLGFLVADKVFTHFNKGTVSKEKLETIKRDLAPRADLSERKNKARIDALETIMGLPSDISEEKLDAIVKKQKQGFEKEKPKDRPPLESFYR